MNVAAQRERVLVDDWRQFASRLHVAALAAAFAILLLPRPAVGEIFICAGNAILVFADNATGSDAPLRSITGDATGINECYDVAYDVVHDEIVVAANKVLVFPGGVFGNVAPARAIFGANTSIGFAASVAIDVQSDELIVGSTGPNAILRFPRTADGNVFPIYGFAPAEDAPPVPIYLDRIRDEIAVSRWQGNPNVVRYYNRLNGVQVNTHSAVQTAGVPNGLHIDPLTGNISVVSGTGVQTFDHGATQISEFHASALTNPFGLAVLASGQVWVGNQVDANPNPLYLFPAGAQGGVFPVGAINNGSVPNNKAWGIASSRSAACGAAHVACDSVFRWGFDTVFR